MDFNEKIEALRWLVNSGNSQHSVTDAEHEELQAFLDKIEENADAFVTLMKLIGEVER